MLHVRAFVYDGFTTAGKLVDTLREEAPETRYFVDHVAVISRSPAGFIRVSSTWAQNDDETSAGAAIGAITGGLVGALLGPAGAVAGALSGGAMFGMVGLGVDLAVEDPELEVLAARLQDDTSALVLVADDDTTRDFVSALEPYEGMLIETDLNEHDVAALRETLKADRARA